VASEALLRIKVVADTAGAALGLDKSAGSVSKFGRAMQRAALPAAAIVGAIGAGAKAAIDAASDYQQAQGAVDAVFGRQARAVEALSKTSADRLGLAGSEYLNYAALVGAALQNSGFTTQQAVKKQDVLLTRAADLAATYGGTTADAVDAINAAVSRGEFDPLEKYAVSLNMTAVNAELAKRGQDKLTGAALKHAKAQVVLSMLMEQTGKAAGQFARESDTAAGQQQRATAAAKDAAAALGTALLPAYTSLMRVLAQFAKWAAKHKTLVLAMAAVLAVLSVAVLATAAAMAVMAAAEAAVLWPILLVVAAVAALAIGFTLLWKKSALFRTVVTATWNAVRAGAQAAARGVASAWKGTWAFLSAAAKVTGAVVRGVMSGIRAAVSAVSGFVRAAWRLTWSVASAYVRTYLTIIRVVLSAVRGIVSTVASWIKTRFSSAWAAVKAGASAVAGPVRSAFNNVKDAVADAIGKVRDLIDVLGNIKVPGAVVSAVNAIKSAVSGAISAVRSLIGWLSRIRVPKISLPGKKSVAGKAVPMVVTPRTPGVPMPGGGVSRTAPASAGISITINGAVDPEAVARQLQRILSGHDRRVGLVGR
jgi:hypothetical protein